MQFRVPQNIAMEDRIVGPLSPIQFGIVVIGGGISFFVFQSVWMAPFNVIIALFLAIFTTVLAIGKFNDQHMYRFIKFFVLFAIRPRVRIWHKEGSEVVLVKPTPQKATEEHKDANKQVSHKDIARLAMVLDSRGNSGVVPKIHPDPVTPQPKQS